MPAAATKPSTSVDPPASVENGEVSAEPGFRAMMADLTKMRLNILVLVTTAVGYGLGRFGASDFDWSRLGLTLLGTGLAAASAAILNQVLERSRDARMHRTRDRPVASGRLSRGLTFMAGVGSGYAGFVVLAGAVDLLAAGLAIANILIYVVIYTPMKPMSSVNTLLGAICGAIPPMIGWAAATGALEVGAWLVGALLFVWQLPHFFALAWLYREDYRRGGHKMLPVLDGSGRITGQGMITTAAMLIPIGLLSTMFGVTGWWSALGSVLLGVWFTMRCLSFWLQPDDVTARSVFLASLAYLPIILTVMVLDRGPVSPDAWLRGGRTSVISESAPSPPVETLEEAKS
ncbi:MAG: protoheme IX farnesyltransferase [Phycisphaerae bacterium]|nr:protoheme IX farnesyltransferase [Phycisphaerae bacterium]